MATQIDSPPQLVTLSPPELTELQQLIAAALPKLAAVSPRLSQVAVLTQPFFTRHRIYEAQLPGGSLARSVHYAQLPGGAPIILTGNLASLQAVAAAEPPKLPDRDAIRAFASSGDLWTTETELGELLLKSFDELPWLPDLHIGEQSLIDDLQHMLGDQVDPPRVTQVGDTAVVTTWLLSRCTLVRRELHVTSAGQLSRHDEVMATELPVPPGNLWGLVNGRLVPTG